MKKKMIIFPGIICMLLLATSCSSRDETPDTGNESAPVYYSEQTPVHYSILDEKDLELRDEDENRIRNRIRYVDVVTYRGKRKVRRLTQKDRNMDGKFDRTIQYFYGPSGLAFMRSQYESGGIAEAFYRTGGVEITLRDDNEDGQREEMTFTLPGGSVFEAFQLDDGGVYHPVPADVLRERRNQNKEVTDFVEGLQKARTMEKEEK